MRPTKRVPVQKHKSAGKFRAQAARTKKINLAPPPARGGYRL